MPKSCKTAILDNGLYPQEVSPINKLSYEVLHLIFEMNTNMCYKTECHDPAFLTLQNCSHVSKRWRHIIVNSPFLWSRVVNLAFLRNTEWREQVIGRTGRRPLSVTAAVRPAVFDFSARRADGNDQEEDADIIFAQAILDLMERNWSRMQYLDVTFEDMAFIWPSIGSRVWKFLRKPPSPLLHTFRFRIPQQTRTPEGEWVAILPPRGFKLLDGDVISLISFDSPTVIDLNDLGLSGIRDLSLCGPLPMDELLRALSSMPLLENLEDTRHSIMQKSSGALVPRASLPSLKKLIIKSTKLDFQPYVEFLRHVFPMSAPKRRVEISIDATPEPTWNAFEVWRHFPFLLLLLKSLSYHCGFDTAREVHFRILEYRLGLKVVVPPYGTSSFDLNLNGQAPLTQFQVDGFLGVIILFRRIHLLRLHIDEGLHIIWSTEIIAKWLSSLSSAKILQTSPVTFEFLEGHIRFLNFPRLQLIKLEYCPTPSNLPFVEKVLTSLLEGSRLSTMTIDMVSNNREEKVADMRWVEQFVGLEVFFLGREEDDHLRYICGSNRYEMLCEIPLYYAFG